MLIDRSHRGWAIFTALLLIIATTSYVIYARSWPNGPSGRTWPGMLFGIAGTVLMVFAGLLSVRKKTVRLRLGSLSWWLKGHIWLGSLSVPVILFHAAFRWGGSLEILLWIVLAMVIGSGLIGLALQNVLPRLMKVQLPVEAIPDQFAEVCRRLIVSADEKVLAQCPPSVVQAAITRPPEGAALGQSEPLNGLASFYIDTVRPYLGQASSNDRLLASREQSTQVFVRVRAALPETCHATVFSLEQVCDERRQLAQQMRYYRWLHGWLKIHIPFSVALLVFVVIHIITALYY